MAYCDWTDVESVFPLAGTIEAVGDNQSELLAEASDLADAYLAGVIRTPVEIPSGDTAYPRLVVRVTALLCADLVAARRFDGPEDQWQHDYDGHSYMGTRFGHRAMAQIQAMRQAKAFTEEQDTEPDLSIPKLDVSGFTTTDGTVEVRFLNGRFMRETRTTYLFEVRTHTGTVAEGDLSWIITRDADEELYDVYNPLVVPDTGWINIENGLQVRFVDGATAAWENAETFEIVCEPFTDQVADPGVTSREINLA